MVCRVWKESLWYACKFTGTQRPECQDLSLSVWREEKGRASACRRTENLLSLGLRSGYSTAGKSHLSKKQTEARKLVN